MNLSAVKALAADHLVDMIADLLYSIAFGAIEFSSTLPLQKQMKRHPGHYF
jgi:hypothetical protein